MSKIVRGNDFAKAREEFHSVRLEAINTIAHIIKEVSSKKKKIKADILIGESFGLITGLGRVYLTKNGLEGRWSGDRGSRPVTVDEFISYCLDADSKIDDALESLERAGLL